jgi:hypothetical protein
MAANNMSLTDRLDEPDTSGGRISRFGNRYPSPPGVPEDYCARILNRAHSHWYRMTGDPLGQYSPEVQELAIFRRALWQLATDVQESRGDALRQTRQR